MLSVLALESLLLNVPLLNTQYLYLSTIMEQIPFHHRLSHFIFHLLYIFVSTQIFNPSCAYSS